MRNRPRIKRFCWRRTLNRFSSDFRNGPSRHIAPPHDLGRFVSKADMGIVASGQIQSTRPYDAAWCRSRSREIVIWETA